MNPNVITLVREDFNAAELAEAFDLTTPEAKMMHRAAVRVIDRQDRQAKAKADWDKATRRRMQLEALRDEVAGLPRY